MNKHRLPKENEVLPDRTDPVAINGTHFVHGRTIVPPFPRHLEHMLFGMGCFWGAERKFWQIPEVFTTSVGYAGGITKNPSYEDVCTGRTGHAEVVKVTFDPLEIDYSRLLTVFWENHDPTQGMRQGNDVGTQYRSVIYYYSNAQKAACEQSFEQYQQQLNRSGFSDITTEIKPAATYFYAEQYHQQYLAKVPNGYCGLQGTGISCKVEDLALPDIEVPEL